MSVQVASDSVGRGTGSAGPGTAGEGRPQVSDRQVIENMLRSGGAFARNLGECAARADPENLARIKAAFPEYWRDYGHFYSDCARAAGEDAPAAVTRSVVPIWLERWNIMIALEVLGRGPGCAIMEIAAAAFRMQSDGTLEIQTFETGVDPVSCFKGGLVIDGSSVREWFRRDCSRFSDARMLPPLRSALGLLDQFYTYVCKQPPINKDPIGIWSSHAGFELSILDVACRSVDRLPVWSVGHERCFRTFISLHPETRWDISAANTAMERALTKVQFIGKCFGMSALRANGVNQRF